MNRRQRLMIAILAIAAAALVVPGFSTAAFTSQTSSTGTVSAAADWTPPTVSVVDPGAAVKGTTTIGVNATDAESGIQGVVLQLQPAAGGAWTTICSTTTSPYNCAWDTTARTDGSYLLRAIATDRAGYSTTSATVRTTVANSLTVSITSLPEFVRGNVAVQATVNNASGLSPVVSIEYAPAGSSSWTTVCANLSSPYTCSASTAGNIANGSYDVRAVAAVGNATYTSAPVRTFVDNQAPAVTMTDPGATLTGTKTFAATATDTGSGVDTVVIQYATGSSWSTLCTIDTAPYSCSFDTASLPNGTYSFRAVATDNAGNTTTSAVVTNRTVRNIVSTITLEDTGPYLRAIVTLRGTTTTNGTISSVTFQSARAGSNSWSNLCVDTTADYTCGVNAGGSADGTYDLRAILTDSDGNTTVSAVLAGRIVDNTGPSGIDVQATNGGTAGKIDPGDTIIFTYSELMDLNSILPGWDGSAPASISGTLANGSPDSLSFNGSGSQPRIGTIELNANFMSNNTAVTIGASMTASTTSVGGVSRTVITMRITSGASNRTPNTAATLTWTPSASATDLAGNPMSTARVTESGSNDRDF